MNHINTSIRRRRRRKTPPIEFFHTIDPRRAHARTERTSASMRAGCRRTRAQIWDFRIGYKYLSDLSVRVCVCNNIIQSNQFNNLVHLTGRTADRLEPIAVSKTLTALLL